MIEFKDITLADKDLIQSFTLGSLRRNCDLSFANLCSWIFLYQTKYAVMDNYLLLLNADRLFISNAHPNDHTY